MDSWTKGEALSFAQQKLDEHGLEGWIFKLNTNRRRHGVCKYRVRRIELSVYALPLGAKTCQDTILHEVAHALAGHGAHHGPEWRRKALEIGCSGQRCASETLAGPSKWVGTCNRCEKEFKYHRRPKYLGCLYEHRKCGGYIAFKKRW